MCDGVHDDLLHGNAGLVQDRDAVGRLGEGEGLGKENPREAGAPGIAEEMVFRGVLLALFDRALGRPWRIAGADIGWGTVITAVVFAAGHAIAVDRSGAVEIEPMLAIGPLVGGLVAGWGRSRLGTLAPLILIHNASNLVIPLATLWLSA